MDTPVLALDMPMSPWQQWLLVFRPQAYTTGLRQLYGDLVAFSRQAERMVVILTPEGARQVLSADPNGYEAFWKAGFIGLVGPGSLWVLGGEAHRRGRQLLAPALHVRGFRGYGELIRQAACRHFEPWRPGQALRALDTTLAITTSVIMRVVFRVADGPFVEEGRRVISALWRTMHPAIVFFPGLQRPWFPLWARYARARAEFTDWVRRYLGQRRAEADRTDDVLGRMLAARYEDGSPMRDADFGYELNTILLAGLETTALALAWALYDLSRHPAVLGKLRAELKSLGPELDPGLTVKLPYLGAVCYETLRLHTLLAEVGRVATAPVALFGHTFPPGTWLVVSVIAIHHDPELYPRPEAFVPERFLERSYGAFEFLPFGGGHLRCLGSVLAEYELRLAVAELVLHWDMEPAATDYDIRHDLAMGPQHGVRLQIKGRRPAARSQVHAAPSGETVHA